MKTKLTKRSNLTVTFHLIQNILNNLSTENFLIPETDARHFGMKLVSEESLAGLFGCGQKQKSSSLTQLIFFFMQTISE